MEPVIDGESEGGDCDEVICAGWGEPGEWTEWGWRNEEGSWFHRYKGDACLKERLVISLICNEEDTDGRARVTKDEERVLLVDWTEIRFRSFNHSTCKTVLNLLEAVYLGLRKIEVKRVTVVKFRVDNRGNNGTGCFRIKVRTDTAELTDMRIAGLRKWRDLIRESKIFIKPRLRTEWVVLSEELSILESCCLRPIMRNSFLEELIVRRFADIQEEICFRAVWRWAILESKLRGWNKDIVSTEISLCR